MFLIAFALAAPALPPQPMTVETFQDAITDRISAYATLRDGDSRLVVGCDRAGGDIKISVHSDRWLVRGALFHGHRNFIHRFDRDRPRRQLWIPDHRSATLVKDRRILPFLRGMASSGHVVIRMRDVEDRWYDTSFRLTNVRPALVQVLQTCRRPDIAERALGEA
ncbi:MAG TPA: hypothetical protein VFO69_10650 [Allosphingosinicella sp.]|nr:hypothetical protein [Allosphingosinicella sp.]